MNKPRIYISGKIAGLKPKEAKSNFAMAEFGLQDDWEVINPFDIKHCEAFSWADYLLRDLMYLKCCDAIYMLRDWKDSSGARVEHAFAQGMGIEIIYEEEE